LKGFNYVIFYIHYCTFFIEVLVAILFTCVLATHKTLYRFDNKWLPTPTTYTIQSPRRSFSEQAKFVELVDQDTGDYNVKLLKNNFWTEEAEIIFQISLSKYCQPHRRFHCKECLSDRIKRHKGDGFTHSETSNF
jgi:hypothetical protein